jgi:acetyl esterase/lipase
MSGKSLPQMFGLILVIVSLVGCSGAQAVPTAKSVPASAIPTPAPSPVTATAIPTNEPTVKVTKDIAYTTPLQPGTIPEVPSINQVGYGVVQKLDVYAPADSGPWPVVVLAHGIIESKESYADLSQALAEQGVVVFTVNLPMSLPNIAVRENGVRYRESHETLACAVRFARAMAPDYGGDPARVTLAGFSMGGARGAYIALVGDDLDRLWEEFTSVRGGPPPQVECAVNGATAHVDAFVGAFGCYNWIDLLQEKDPELWELNSIYTHLGKNPDLKVRLIHGEEDYQCPYEFAVKFDAALAEAGYDTELTPFEGGHWLPAQLTVEKIMDVVEE